MQKPFAMIFGGAIAYILLFLYAGTVVHLIREVVACAHEASCERRDFTEGVINVVTLIGGLVSALVVSKLTITKPGENPGIFRMTEGQGKVGRNVSATLVLAYLAVWLVTGLAALVVGVMMHPGVNETLGGIGTTWLGVAVAAGYAYFGLDPVTQ